MKTQLIPLICLAGAVGAYGMSPEEYYKAREPFDVVISRSEMQGKELDNKCAVLVEENNRLTTYSSAFFKVLESDTFSMNEKVIAHGCIWLVMQRRTEITAEVMQLSEQYRKSATKNVEEAACIAGDVMDRARAAMNKKLKEIDQETAELIGFDQEN